MASVKPSRDLVRARSAYLAMVARLTDALNAFHVARVPFGPDRSGKLPPWTDEQIRAVVGLSAAWSDVVTARKDLEPLIRSSDSLIPRPDQRQR